MLAFIASHLPRPAVETADRDPGILTLAFALARGLRRAAEASFNRRCAMARDAGGPSPL